MSTVESYPAATDLGKQGGVWSASAWAGEPQRELGRRRSSLASVRKLFRKAFYSSLGVLQIDERSGRITGA